MKEQATVPTMPEVATRASRGLNHANTNLCGEEPSYGSGGTHRRTSGTGAASPDGGAQQEVKGEGDI